MKKAWRHVKPFCCSTGTWQTDRRTDRQTELLYQDCASALLCSRMIKTCNEFMFCCYRENFQRLRVYKNQKPTVSALLTILMHSLIWCLMCPVTRVLPWKSSGAAYGGLPQNVSSFESLLNSLLKPKSAILMFISLSSRRFSACNTTHTSDTAEWQLQLSSTTTNLTLWWAH